MKRVTPGEPTPFFGHYALDRIGFSPRIREC
jgi:hypothetical protein